MRGKLIQDYSEQALLESIRSWLPDVPAGFSLPIHDVAHTPPPRSGEEVILTADILTSGVHFNLALMGGYYCGWRAVAANLSDCAAAGARPIALTVSLTLPPKLPFATLHSLYSGMVDCLKRYGAGAVLVGGDITSGNTLTIAISLMGYAPANKRLGRAGAIPGDLLAVTGWTGRAARGLELLKLDLPSVDTPCVTRFLAPTPRLEAAKLLATCGIHALTDTSDSLWEAAENIATASDCGVVLAAETLPLADTWKWQPEPAHQYELAWGGGEDFELVVALPASHYEAARKLLATLDLPLTVVGHFTAEPEIIILASGKAIEPPVTFEHFG